jgi:outer membrane protein assembly factor BamB
MRFRLAALVLTLTSVVQAGDSWPQFRGPNGDGVADAKTLPTMWSETENVRWKTAIHDKGWSSPVVLGDQIWLTTAKEKYAENAPKEQPARTTPRPEWVEFYAVCVDRNTGKIVHDVMLRKQENPAFCISYNSYATPTPVVEPGRVYVHFGSHGTYCLDTETAKVLWERLDLKCDHWRGPGSSPILVDNLLVLTFDGHDLQYVAALDKADGKTVWKKDRKIKYERDDGDIKKAYSTPSVFTVSGKKQIVSPAAEATIAYDSATGDELWRVHHGGMNEACRPLMGHGLVFLSSGHTANVLAVKPGQGTLPKDAVAWRTNKGGPSRPSMLLLGDYLYMVSDRGTATCLDAKTGNQVWQERLGGDFDASPVAGAGHIYFMDRDGGKTHVIEAGPTIKLIAVNKLDAGCMASPAVVGEDLIVRTKTHLYCIGKK